MSHKLFNDISKNIYRRIIRSRFSVSAVKTLFRVPTIPPAMQATAAQTNDEFERFAGFWVDCLTVNAKPT